MSSSVFGCTHLSITRRAFVAAIFILSAAVCPRVAAAATSPDGIWRTADPATGRTASATPWIQPARYALFNLDPAPLLSLTATAPAEARVAPKSSSAEITLPTPNGTFQRFRFVESPIMDKQLADQFPGIRTYCGQGIDDPQANVRFDWTPQGFHASVLAVSGTWYVDPYLRGDTSLHVSYFKRDYTTREPWRCLVEDTGLLPDIDERVNAPRRSGETLRTYRLACAATGEYTAYHSAPNPANVTAGQAAIVTAWNRVNQVYEAELAIRFILVANNSLLVYTDGSTDPYTNDDGSAMLGQNQTNVDAVIGSANYDIGHAFSTGGGGVAMPGVVCQAGMKAMGITGTGAPINDPFYIDYVAHEAGHQFSGMHTWNCLTGSCSPGQYIAGSAMEPGSASTIMGYAGICSPNDLQPHSDPYFHSISFDEIIAYSTVGGGNACPTATATGNQHPTVNAGADYAIPIGTPFTLTASGSDPDGDPLTFCWEERDLGPAINLTDPDNGLSPLFRSFNPTTGPSRTFPQLQAIIMNATSWGEQLPAVARNPMRFRVTARDNRAGGGGVNTDDMQLNVVGTAGPFMVTSPNTAVTWYGTRTVTWNVANTNAAPIGTANVDILLSTDGGWTFPITLAANTPNDGSESVALPVVSTTQARVKVRAVGNVYWDMSNTDFTLQGEADLAITKTAAPDPVILGNNLVYTIGVMNNGPIGATGVTVVDPLPAGQTFVGATTSQGSCAEAAGTVTCNLGSLANGANATVTITVLPTSAGSPTNTATVTAVEPDPSPANNSASVTSVVEIRADLAVTKTAAPDPVIVGNNLVYTVGVTNNGPNDATAVTVTDPLPPGLTFVAATASQGSCAEAAGTVTCNLGALANGANATVTITVAPTVAGNPTNTVTVAAPEPDPNPANNSASVASVVDALADLAIVKTAAPDPAEITLPLVYTLTVTNNGPGSASGVTVTDTMPADVAFSSFTATAGTHTLAGNVLTWNVGALVNGATATATITVVPSVIGNKTNTATVTAVEPDPDAANNTATVGTPVGPGPDLTGSILSVYRVGRNVYGRFTLQNIGTLNAPFSSTRFYLSTDNTPSPDDSLMTMTSGSMAAGQSRVMRHRHVLKPGQTMTGMYLIVRIDWNNRVAEMNEDNNLIVFGPLP